MVGVQVHRIRLAQCGGRGRHVEHLLGAGAHRRLVKLPRPGGRHDLARPVQAGAGHLQRASRPGRVDRAVRAAPVGHDHPVEAPFGAQDLGEQVRVLVGVGAVDAVVGAHERARRRLAHHDFEGRQVDLPHGPLIDNRVRGHAPQLLGVDGEVLGAGRDPLRLDAPHHARGHAPRQQGVLRVVLEVAPAQRGALDVQARAQQHVHAQRPRLAAQRLAHPLGQCGVPRVRDRGRRGEACRLLRGGDTQMVAVPELAPHPVGAVAHHEGGDGGSGNRAGVPLTGSG